MLVDLLIVAFVLSLAFVGYRRGFLIAAVAVTGFAVGAFAGTQLAQVLLGGDAERYAPIVMASGLVLGAVLALTSEETAHARLGRAARRALGPLRRSGGAVVLAGLVLAQAWMLGAVMLYTEDPEGAESSGPRSQILTHLHETLPATGPLVDVLVGVEPPRFRASPGDERARGIAQSVVKVSSLACGVVLQGSGWVAAPGTVVTNAHVVAGAEETAVGTAAGSELDATPIRYRPGGDLAVLRVEGLDAPALELANEPAAGTAARALGYPRNGGFTAIPVRLGETARMLIEDLYGRGPLQRELTAFRGELRPGASGGPVVDASGRVLTTLFGALEEDVSNGLGVPNEVVSRALRGASGARAADPGACASNR